MKTIKQLILGLTALTGIALTSTSHAVFIDLTGIEVDGGSPTILSVSEDEDLSDPFDIFYSLRIHHIGSSWVSETLITLNNFRIETPIVISGASDCGFENIDGFFTCSGMINVTDPLFSGDVWTITLADTWNDSANPDYVFDEGSYLAWGNDAPTAVPEPSVLLLVGSGIFGFGAIRLFKTKR